MKKLYFTKYASICVILLFAVSLIFTGCKNYNEDIDHLQKQIDEAKTELSKLLNAINEGEIIISVEAIVDGIKITTNKGSYEIKHGTDGEKGAVGDKGDAAVIEIGENGNWWINGVDSGKPSRGEKGDNGDKGEKGDPGDPGDKGEKGDAGSNGSTGANGKYYLPNPETGTWFEYSDTNPEGVDTGESYWPGDAIAAVVIDGILYLSNVTDKDGKVMEPIAFNMGGNKLFGLLLMPDWLIDNVPGTKFNALQYYCLDPETEKPKINEITKLPLWDFACEAVWMRYRLNPPTIWESIDMENLIAHLKDTKTISTRAGIRSGGSPEVLDAELVTNGWKGKDLRVKVRLNLKPSNSEESYDMISLWAHLKGQGEEDYIASDYSLAYVDSTSYYNIAYNNQYYNETAGWYSGEVRKRNSALYNGAEKNMNYYYAMELSDAVRGINVTDTILAYNNTTGIDLLHMVKTTKHEKGDRQPIAKGGDIPIADYNMGYEFDLVKPLRDFHSDESYDEDGNYLFKVEEDNPYFELIDGRYLVAKADLDDPNVTKTPKNADDEMNDVNRKYVYVRVQLKNKAPGAEALRVARIAYIKVMLVSQVPLLPWE